MGRNGEPRGVMAVHLSGDNYGIGCLLCASSKVDVNGIYSFAVGFYM